MAGILGRSKSLRMLRRGGHEESHQREIGLRTPQPTLSQADLGRLKEASFPRPDERVETPEMLQRPKTSGGAGDRSTLFHKKVQPLQQQEPENQGFEFAPLSPTKSSTFLYAAEFRESREGIIGIALGSPTMATHPHWNVTSPGSDFVSDSQGTITHISSNNQPPYPFPEDQTVEVQREPPKPKISRWKSLFRKTKPPPRPREKESFYQLANSVTPARADSHHDDDSQEEESVVSSPATYTYNPSIRESRKLPKGHAQPADDTRLRALTVDTVSRSKTSLLRSASSPKIPRLFSRSPTVPQVVVSNDGQSTSPRTIPGDKPLLDVDIPEVHMERYSVMFSSLLQQDPSSSSNPSSSSLLQRRQAEQLKPLNQLTMKNEPSHLKPQRRATSPSVPKSPSAYLSLFPSANTSRTPSPRLIQNTVNRPRPFHRNRSQTAPFSSPHLPLPGHEFENEGTIGLAITPPTETPRTLTPLTPLTDVMSATPTPSSRHSFEFDGGNEEISIKRVRSKEKAFKPEIPKEEEPEWEILPPAPKRSISRASALRSHPTSTEPSSAPLEPPVTIGTASPVTLIRSPSSARSTHLSPTSRSTVVSPITESVNGIGVARSVSVTRANSPLLRRSTTNTGLMVPGAHVGGDNRALTPTLVEMKNRKSQRVQLVDT
ncbi:hypothetical protein P280DRAFT_179479 [Massarina eburnea CBS 473.64]|uniref:Uncharacterized protein n=1 Tax=Massarina eburnea CBS 473.64 TaxID=1395130 RepID=A0A6A6SEV8_9PLEO|nr:hypothetical protein P280DRAFT_179479 [Massarina eburnea CBS 473.64]